MRKVEYTFIWSTNVGKTTTGEILARRLKYDFYDLDEEVKNYYKVTLEEFVNTGTLRERDRKWGVVITGYVHDL